MNKIVSATCLIAALWLGLPGASIAQRTSIGSTGSLEIAQNAMTFKRAEFNRQLRDVQRCIANASNPILLRDPQGNINRVPQTDLINCSRKLAQLRRQFTSLQRQIGQLSQDATFQSILVQDTLLISQRKRRIRK